MFKALFFDVGGVLVRSEDPRTRQRLAARLGVPEAEIYHHVFDSPAAIAATTGQVPESAVWAHVREHFQLDEAGFNTFFVDFWAGDQLDTELLLFLHHCRPRYKTAFLSNAWDGARRLFTEKYRMMWAVDDAIISAEVGMAKPVAAIYQLAAARLGVQPHEALFLDDVPANLAAAEAVGMTGMRFHNTAQAIADIQAKLR